MPVRNIWQGRQSHAAGDFAGFDGPARFSQRAGDDPRNAVNEPSDVIPGDASTPYVVTVGGSETGVINSDGDRDWFQISLTQGEIYIFELIGSSGAPLVNPHLRIYDSTGALVASNDDAYEGFEFHSVTTYAPATGVYYIEAASSGDVGVGGYTISAGISTPLDAINWEQTMATTSIDVYFATSGQSFNGETASRSWTSAEIAAAMAALRTFEDFTPLNFNQVGSASGAEMVLSLANLGGGLLGYFEVGTPYGFFDPVVSGWNSTVLQQGGYAFATLLHEAGHGLGLAHPHDNGGGSTVMSGVNGPWSWGNWSLNQGVFTIMSYNDGWPAAPGDVPQPSTSGIGWQGTPMALDIAMLQQFYGADAFNTGNNTYTLSSATTMYRCLWDTSGTDTIAFAGAADATIDLRAATLQYEDGGGGWLSYVDGVSGGFTIANGVVIENATGGSGADRISGNSAANQLSGAGGADTLYGGGNDTLLGGDGDDVLYGVAGDVIDGGVGNDVARDLDLSAVTTSIVFDAAQIMSAGGVTVAGITIRNTEGFELETGSGDDVLTTTIIAGQSSWGGGVGVDHFILDLSATSEGTGLSGSITRTFRAGDDQLFLYDVERYTMSGGSGEDSWGGGAYADVLSGNGGSDGLYGDGGDDILDGGSGNDILIGGDGADDLTGGDGADELNGSAGADVVRGGLGDDIVYGGGANDWVDAGDGNDTAIIGLHNEVATFVVDMTSLATATGITFANGAHIHNAERFHLATGDGDDELIGDHTILDSTWSASGGIDRLTLDLSAVAHGITMAHGFAEPLFHAGHRIEVTVNGVTMTTLYTEVASITGGSGADNLVGYNFADVFNGGEGDDQLYGHAGDDTLAGGDGVDSLFGGAGNDLYVWDGVDALTELAGEGADTVQTSLAYALGAELENLTLTGATAIGGAGNGLNNIVTGNNADNALSGAAGDDTLIGVDGNDSLDGGAGADSLSGGLGDDVFYIDDAGDTVTENASEGTDTVRSAVGMAALAANVENLVMLGAAVTANGNALNNTIIGNGANNSINGQAGADNMSGGLGNDTYFVDNAGDVVTENSGEGTDIIFSTINIAALAANVENLTISGAALTATGNFLNNTIAGNSQNNTLNGGSGEDTLVGGIGNDLYLVNSAGDVVTEGLGAGTDSILAFINIDALVANVENVTLAGTATSATGNELSNILTGNGLDNTLVGGLGNDQLNGGVGADTMSGGGGDDAYLVENAGDVTIELGGEGNNDIVYAFITLASLADNIERVTITGVGNLSAFGNALANRINGNAGNNALGGFEGNDVIQGLAGADNINGGLGLDILTGGADADLFVFTTVNDSGITGATRDVINDFTQGADLIHLGDIDAITGGGDDAFSLIGTAAFSNTAGELRFDQIDNASGADYTIISMDVNGDGIADSQITLVGLVTLTVSDFGL